MDGQPTKENLQLQLTALSQSSTSRLIRVKNSNMALVVDPSMEKMRSFLYLPLLEKHGRMRREVNNFNASKYNALSPFTRCFDNAMETALRYDLVYVEGLLLFTLEDGALFSMAHGWCETVSGEVVDATCSKNQCHPSINYFGLKIKTEYSQAWFNRVGYYGCLDGDIHGRPIGVHHEPVNTWLREVP